MTRKTKLVFYTSMIGLNLAVLAGAIYDGKTPPMFCSAFAIACFSLCLVAWKYGPNAD